MSEAKKVRPALEQALAFNGPALVDIDVDPNEPPLPGKVQYDQAKKFARPSCRASRTRRRSRPPCSRTRSSS